MILMALLGPNDFLGHAMAANIIQWALLYLQQLLLITSVGITFATVTANCFG
jgi:hypothetical protein